MNNLRQFLECFLQINQEYLDLLTLSAAVSSPTTRFKSSKSTKPFSFDLTVIVSKPATDAEAGLVP